jgi:hypothetical protein
MEKDYRATEAAQAAERCAKQQLNTGYRVEYYLFKRHVYVSNNANWVTRSKK